MEKSTPTITDDQPETHNPATSWNGPDDPDCPFNWSLTKRWSILLLSSFGGMVTLMSASMMAPALGDIGHDLGITESETNMGVSIFLLAFALGPMFLAPLAEVFGRRWVWILASTWYVLWNTVCGFAHTRGVLLAGRIMSGLGASAEFAISAPVRSDCWPPEQRGYSFAIATFIPLTGTAVGPILGGVLTQKLGWRWLFWILSIFDATLVVYAFFFFPETYHRLLLHRRAVKARGPHATTTDDVQSVPLARKLCYSLARPCWMLATQPTIQIMAVFLAYNYGVLFLVLTSFATLWIERYHQSVLISGLHYIAIVIGYTIASQGGGRITDWLWKYLTATRGHTAPEYRIPLMVPGLVFLLAGLVWYGWAAEKLAPWIVVDIGAAVFGCGVILSTQAMQQYVMDSYLEFVASANAASFFVRSIFAFCFPIFAPALYDRLGYGWGNSMLAFIMIGFGVPAPFLVWIYGARLREIGRQRAKGKVFLA
ncbi:major facilitator superfamily transporter [Aspergillus varians]